MSATTAVEMPEIGATGLTPKEVVQRIESGQSNAVKTSSSRSVQDIVRANVFTLFNGIIFAAMVLVLITGSWRDAVFGFVIIINTGIGIVTELRAKRTLDKLSILVASEFLVRRDGKDVEVSHNEIVLDDLLWIRAGEQVPADGQIIQTWGLELDESMLTGESRTVRHKVGEQVYSGATAVSGMALVKVNAVGSHSYAATLTAQAKVYKKTVSDLNKGINTILKFMTFLVVPLCILLILSQIHTVGGWHAALSTGEWRQAVVSAVAGVVGMIPEGLVLLTSLNFAVAAMRLARHDTLVQELESVETLARVDALNLDKTGTITDGGIAFDRLVMLDSANATAEQTATQALYDCCNEEQPNGTGQAVLAGLKAQGYGAGTVESRVPFSSARKWSAVRKSGETWYMGAPEVIISALEGDYSSVLQQVNEYANDGNRVLLVARSTAPLSPLRGQLPSEREAAAGTAELPADVTLTAVGDHKATFQMDGQDYATDVKLEGVYNLYNAAAALAVVRAVMQDNAAASKATAAANACAVSADELIAAVSRVTPAFGRGEVIDVNGSPVELLLVKNPMGFRLSLASFDPANADTMIAINDEYADGRDMSWLWDVDFTSLRASGVAMVSGVRAWDMALRLGYDQVPVADTNTDLEQAVTAFVNANPGTRKHIYCTYTAMLKTRAVLGRITEVRDAGVGK